jgi:hypothetical protein
MATEEWVVMTGEDNYYTPKFVEFFLDAAKSNLKSNFIYCDIVHNWINFEYIYIKSEPKFGKMDIGNFMSKREMAKQIKLDTSFPQSDWKFISQYLNIYKSELIYIPKILYIHN